MKEENLTQNHSGNNNSQRANNVKSIYELKDGRKVVDVQLDCINIIELHHMIFHQQAKEI